MSSSITAQLVLVHGDSDSFQQIIELENKNRSIGRGRKSDIVWRSLNISKKHATLQYIAPTWNIRDTSSNGLSVNGIRLVKGELFPLKDADVISFIPPGEVLYMFRYTEPTAPLRGAVAANNLREHQLIPNSPRPSTSSAANLQLTSDQTESKPSVDLIENGNHSDNSNHSESFLSLDHPNDCFGLIGNVCARSTNPIPSDWASASCGPKSTKTKLKVDPLDYSDEHTGRKKYKRVIRFTSSSDDEDKYNKSESNDPSSSFKTLGLPEENGCLSEEQISKIYDPETLRELLKEWTTKLKRTEVNLQAVKCERAMEQEDLRQMERDARSVNTAFKEETYKKILEILDTELSCSVCNEVFIQATVVDCGHTFCLFCINEWARKKIECPLCKQKFRNRSRHIEMDNFVHKIFESFSEEIKTNRKKCIREREEQVIKALEDARAAVTENQQRQTEEDSDGARILVRVIEDVAAGFTGESSPPLLVAPRRTRAQRGRTRAAYHAYF